MITKITSFTEHITAEGTRISFTYSVIDESGEVIKQNVRKDIIVVDKDVQNAIDSITEFLLSKVEE